LAAGEAGFLTLIQVHGTPGTIRRAIALGYDALDAKGASVAKDNRPIGLEMIGKVYAVLDRPKDLRERGPAFL
jgi:hypothetical protein